MAYTVPHTWVAGDFLRASWLNLTTTDLVDHEARIVALEATGTGNVTGQASSVDSEIALFSSTTGKVIKRATGTGYVKAVSGVYQTPSATVPLATDVSGDLPFANLTQGSALSVLGVAGNATADHASIVAASDGQVFRRSGTAVGFGAVDLASANAITGALPLANLPTNFAQIFKATVTLTDAQIKAFPTTSITLVAAQGAGKRIFFIQADCRMESTAAAYTNINAAAYLVLATPAEAVTVSNYLFNDTGSSTTGFSDAFGTTNDATWVMVPYARNIGTDNMPPATSSASSLENTALVAFVNNQGSGNLTGGNAANSLIVTVLYMVI